MRRTRPELTEEHLWTEVEKYWAKGTISGEIDPASPPPHSTGAAVDLTIRVIASGQQLYMGSVFDDLSQLAHPDFFEVLLSQERAVASNEEAGKNRRLLYWVMFEEGFANNPTEWWHFSWGDQMWAALRDCEAAFYSVLKI